MEGEHHYELRSRSRSRSHTPMITNQIISDFESIEHHYDLRSKESRERSYTPAEVSSSRRSNSRLLSNSVQKLKDKNIDSIAEKPEVIQPEIRRENEYKQNNSDSIPPALKKAERRSERQSLKRQIFINEYEESKDNTIFVKEIMKQQQDHQHHHHYHHHQQQQQQQQGQEQEQQLRKSLTPSRTVTSDYSSEEGERDDLLNRPGSAYEIYKQAGEWWNVFPKTDYTYSQASQCRYEIAPGVLAMPNMSRPSIHSDGSSVGSSHSLSQRINELTQSSHSITEGQTDLLNDEITNIIEQNRRNDENVRLLEHSMKGNSDLRLIHKQTHIEQRNHRQEIIYDDFTHTAHTRFGSFSNIDSDTELDEVVSSKINNKKWRITQLFQKLNSIVIFLFVNIIKFIKVKILRKDSIISSHQNNQYYESKWIKTWTKIDRALQYLYLLLIRVLYLDSWLLSRVTNIRNHFLTRRFKMFWLILLPPFFLAGYWLLLHAHNLTFPQFTGILSQQMYDEKMFGPFYQLVTERQKETLVKSSDKINEELRQTIEYLVNRVNKLEAAENNKQELLVNITQSIDEIQNNRKDIWRYYEKKLGNLESKVNAKDDDKSTHYEINSIKMELKYLRQHYAILKTYYSKNNIKLSSINVKHDVEKIMSEYFGSGISKTEMSKIFENLIMSKKDSMVLNCHGECNQDYSSISEAQVRKIVKEILRIYDADKTGRVDYALESAGGQIISIRCTQRYNVNTRAFKLLGFTLFYESGDPRTVIQGHTLQPGVCWAFQDFPGYLLIKLRSLIKVTGFTMEHVSRSILPNNEMRSAPKKFNVWGLKEENDVEPILFGEYEFSENDDSLQYFPVQNKNIIDLYDYIELRIHSNHGQLEYTCLYRFRVHGIPG